MAEHWYDYLPACWLLPEGRWYVIGSIALLILLAFAAGVWVGGMAAPIPRQAINRALERALNPLSARQAGI